ncbi:hypothetical protein PR048_001886 [Dryococelus australis]|uniref:Uncharacterized protein n=1 Tax=Dryococelus australis TaxID=614101 RepID=A0ABQ9IJB6_9NEOP|nr:hypothetical protein PR048_001886 [Dryococelus australis]
MNIVGVKHVANACEDSARRTNASKDFPTFDKRLVTIAARCAVADEPTLLGRPSELVRPTSRGGSPALGVCLVTRLLVSFVQQHQGIGLEMISTFSDKVAASNACKLLCAATQPEFLLPLNFQNATQGASFSSQTILTSYMCLLAKLTTKPTADDGESIKQLVNTYATDVFCSEQGAIGELQIWYRFLASKPHPPQNALDAYLKCSETQFLTVKTLLSILDSLSLNGRKSFKWSGNLKHSSWNSHKLKGCITRILQETMPNEYVCHFILCQFQILASELGSALHSFEAFLSVLQLYTARNQ